ncbi:hypothetical protein EV421DRAFT_1908719 [Armillaria borealis]|uniref:Uncharacterized protein n=1 Tax=Armillaria borealis TaxID=47425 RepID=A0AA39J3H6_9AGAR|nr:hypothetical protein EV421DRAFT_1908719 [Armillaria borealis]
MSSQHSIITFDRNHYLHSFRVAVHHPVLLALFESILGNDTAFLTNLDNHIIAAKQGDKTIYKPSYVLGSAGWAVLQTLSDIVTAATHNITPYSGQSQRPLTIPQSALEELGISSMKDVDITHFHCLPNYLLTLSRPSRDELRSALRVFQQGLRRCIMWLASRINYSVKKGFQARVNWGAFVGMSWDEFLFPEEITMHYYTDDEQSLTCYIPYSPASYPDLATYIHFPYDPRYPRTTFFNDLPRLITNYAENATSSAPVTPSTDVEMKDSAIEDITEQMGNLSLDD